MYLDVTPGVGAPLAKLSEDSTLGCSFLFSRAGIKTDLKIQYSYYSFFFKYYEYSLFENIFSVNCERMEEIHSTCSLKYTQNSYFL